MTDAISRAAVLAILKKMPPGKEMQKQFGRLTRKVEALPGVDVGALEVATISERDMWRARAQKAEGQLTAALAQITATPAARGEDPRPPE